MLKLQAEQPLGETRPCETRGLDKVAVLWLVPPLSFPAAPAHTAPLSLSLGTSTDGTHSWWPLLNTGWPLLLSASWPLGPQPHSVMALLSSCDHSSWPVTPSAPPTRGHDCPCHLHFTGAQCKAGYRDRAKSLLNRSFHLTPAVGRAKGRLSESLG